ncbi:AAA family ATPase [Dehalogenimonas sp. 4OHTPN]|uniref:AAA family ATPase n=1 Tax=Dehalogenimonas sp. 4OHTPN TaxID=3166643 RepID=A0AAU8G7I7_9CHLR
MTVSIAMAGKGGTGKTSVACLIIRHLLRHGGAPVLAVDADPAANLGLGLGLDVGKTVGQVLAGFNENKLLIPPGLSKEASLNIRLNETIVESRDVDLVTMGRGEGAGCYCFPNHVLKSFIDRLLPNYRHLVMDNEAGLEHLSRGTTESVDDLIIMSNHSVKGVRTVGTIVGLVGELKLNVRRKWVVLNQCPAEVDPLVAAELDRLGIGIDATIPEDRLVIEFDWHRRSLLEMPGDSLAVEAVSVLMDKIGSIRFNEVEI